jgi:hypothetical protein
MRRSGRSLLPLGRRAQGLVNGASTIAALASRSKFRIEGRASVREGSEDLQRLYMNHERAVVLNKSRYP